FDIMYGEGISREGDLLDLSADKGLITKSGAWYSYHDERIGQGRENAKKYMKDNPALTAELDIQLRQELGLVRISSDASASTRELAGSRKDKSSDEL
ncbi:MAG TPA: hypothetical protein VE844_18955, partial [Gammaproteobacteria bacterium]|nr:hypothetical protein [Gammaproteobacteria bacterium]